MMKIYVDEDEYPSRIAHLRALIKAGIEAGRKGYDNVRFVVDTNGDTAAVFTMKRRCSRCGGNKYILGVVGPGTRPQNQDIGSIPCPVCNTKKYVTFRKGKS